MSISLYNYKINVIRVIDGDTIYAEIDLGFNIRIKDYIRFDGVDTPETRGSTATDLGQWAKMYTSLWLRGLEGQFDELKTLNLDEAWSKVPRSDTGPWLTNLYLDSKSYNDREKYGRILGYIYRNEALSLNTRLIQEGLKK
ncbi:putative nuclease protein [Rhizobium phage RHph_TM40]|uniref:Putative nuclease protein n=1 Tax=Rhizobium phage RHph_TM30 TaxID=2509764 RepID=A0A7S5RG15_9CAUD|nr:endonuclease [Rhizobium phage RHph_TM30]QIG71384.1 putative nuclease protein [Rhizobium phage RHph_TM30]QIG71748.1 putative nuclease protein [Rhizobium phage RHph_TM40]